MNEFKKLVIRRTNNEITGYDIVIIGKHYKTLEDLNVEIKNFNSKGENMVWYINDDPDLMDLILVAKEKYSNDNLDELEGLLEQAKDISVEIERVVETALENIKKIHEDKDE